MAKFVGRAVELHPDEVVSVRTNNLVAGVDVEVVVTEQCYKQLWMWVNDAEPRQWVVRYSEPPSRLGKVFGRASSLKELKFHGYALTSATDPATCNQELLFAFAPENAETAEDVDLHRWLRKLGTALDGLEKVVGRDG